MVAIFGSNLSAAHPGSPPPTCTATGQSSSEFADASVQALVTAVLAATNRPRVPRGELSPIGPFAGRLRAMLAVHELTCGMKCAILNCPYWCAENPLLKNGDGPHHHRCAEHRDMSTTMRSARRALARSSLGSAAEVSSHDESARWEAAEVSHREHSSPRAAKRADGASAPTERSLHL